MIKHVVMWKLHDNAEGSTKSVNKELIRDKLYHLKSCISEIDVHDVCENMNPSAATFNLVLIITHKNQDAL